MCETFYCKSGQTSQISGKFCGGYFGLQNLNESEYFFIVVHMEEEKKSENWVISPDSRVNY